MKAPPPIDYAISLLMKGETRVVTNMGVRRTIKGKEIWYTNSELTKYQGEKVEIKYFPEDITRVIAYDNKGKRICEALSYELLHIAPKLSEDALIEHIKEQKRQQSITRDTINYRRKDYEERSELDYKLAGKKMVAPKISNEGQKTVSFVNDNRYKEDKKVNKDEEINITHKDVEEKSKSRAEEYLLETGKEVFKRLKNLG